MEVSASSQAYLTWGTGESGPLYSNSDQQFFETHLTTFAICSGYQFEFKKKHCNPSFGYISQFHPKKWPVFGINASETIFLRTRWCIEKKSTSFPEKRLTSLDAPRKKAINSRTWRRARPILPLLSPIQIRLWRCWNLHLFSVFEISLL